MGICPVRNGSVYILQTPLFRVRNKKRLIKGYKKENDTDRKSDFVTRYCYNEEEKMAAIKQLGANPEITRFKGLGEISPDEFKEFIGENMRLEQVRLSADDNIPNLLEFYMGQNTIERQNFIRENLRSDLILEIV